MVNDLVFRWPKPLFFMVLEAHGGWCQPTPSAPVPVRLGVFYVPFGTTCSDLGSLNRFFSGKRSGQGCGRCASRSVGKPNVVGTILPSNSYWNLKLFLPI